jgi:hypothetical protein
MGGVDGTVNLAVQPVNPVANPDAASTRSTPTGQHCGADDVDGKPTGSQRQSCRGTPSARRRWFTPSAFTGPAVISYSISDGAGGTTTNSVTVNVGNNNAP